MKSRIATSRIGPVGVSPAGLFCALVILLTLGGCAGFPDSVRSYGEITAPIEINETPFFPQERYQCGPAALATVLVASDVNTTPDELVDTVYIPARNGSIRTEMIATTRAAGRVPYVLDRRLSSISAELNVGRPVLVLQNLGISWYPKWHYAVVVGIDPVRDEIILRSGTDSRRITKTRTFLHTWRRSDYWAMVALSPNELPADIDLTRYASAVVSLEEVGQLDAAKLAWQTLLASDPNAGIALFALGNRAYDEQAFATAADYFRQAIGIEPEHIAARNNYAMTLLAMGNAKRATAEIEAALEMIKSDDPLREILLESREEILAQTKK